MDDLNEWLKQRKLFQFAAKFEEHGYDSLDCLRSIGQRAVDVDELISDVGMLKGHAKHFRYALAELCRDVPSSSHGRVKVESGEAASTTVLSCYTDAKLKHVLLVPEEIVSLQQHLPTTMRHPWGHRLETALNQILEFIVPLERKARKTLQRSVQKMDHIIDYTNYYYVGPAFKLGKRGTKKMVNQIQDFVAGWVIFYLLIIVAGLQILETVLDAFLPATTQMRARVISSMSTEKDSPCVRIKRHVVSVVFRPVFQVAQISVVQRVLQKTWRVAVLLSDELFGEDTTDAILIKTEACMPEALKVDKPGTPHKVAQAVIGSYQGAVAKQITNSVIGKVGSYMPAWQAEPGSTSGYAAQYRGHARRGVGRPTQTATR